MPSALVVIGLLRIRQGKIFVVTDVLEFWPEYDSGPFWTERGESVDLASVGLPAGPKEQASCLDS